MFPIRLVLFVAMLGVLGIGLPGCGPSYPETIPVSGTVSLGGQPVAGAAVVFTPDEGQQATGTTDSAGRFELSTFRLGDGALPGKHRVTVAKTTVDDDGKIVFLIPREFGNLQTSQLVCDVQKEMGEVQFDLPSGSDQAPELSLPAADVGAPPESGEQEESDEE